MFLLVFAVPALLVVVTGYAIGYRVWAWLGGLIDDVAGTSLAANAEVVGWLTGALTLVLVVRSGVRRRRRGRWPWRWPWQWPRWPQWPG